MNLRSLFLGGLLAVLLFAVVSPVTASPAGDYLHTRRALRRPPMGASLLAAAQQGPGDYLGQVFEIAATVGGVVDADGERTVLLTADGLSLSARLPETLSRAPWIDSGQTLRVLLRVEPTGNDTSLTNLTLLAAAPEGDVAQAERAAAPPARPRSASYPSRALYSRTGRQGEPVAGASYSPANYGDARPIAPLSARALKIYGPYRAAVRMLNRRLSESDVDKIATSILYFSDRYNLDPRLVIATIIAESGFNTNSVSRTGAMGLGQLMPGTARGLGVTNAFDPIQNIGAAVHLLRGHLDQYGGAPADAGLIPFSQIALTMAAYNAGPGAVHKYHGVPPYRETQRYVARVTALYKRLCGLKS